MGYRQAALDFIEHTKRESAKAEAQSNHGQTIHAMQHICSPVIDRNGQKLLARHERVGMRALRRAIFPRRIHDEKGGGGTAGGGVSCMQTAQVVQPAPNATR